MRPVERGQLWVMWIQAVALGLILLFAAAAAESLLIERTEFPPGSLIGVVLLLILYPATIGPVRRYRALGYALGEDELRLARGVWTRSETIVPLGRVQHIDVVQGPLERLFGVSRLALHTAGTLNSLVVLPGLSRETAEAIRDEIRARIRREQP
jgi:membrane protein YdbS with pleckstrin-like domain